MADNAAPLYLRRLNEALQAVASARYVAPDDHGEALEAMESDIEAMMDETADDLGLSEEEYELVRMSIYESLEELGEESE